MEKRDRLKYVLDTNILSYVVEAKLGDRSPSKHWARRHLKIAMISNRCAIPSIAIQEMETGIRKKDLGEKKQRAIRSLHKSLAKLNYDAGAARIMANLKIDLQKAGQPVEDADLQVAAIAIQNNLTLVTNNKKHFERIAAISELRIEDWSALPITWDEYIRKFMHNLLIPIAVPLVMLVIFWVMSGSFIYLTIHAEPAKWLGFFVAAGVSLALLFAGYKALFRMLVFLAMRFPKPLVP